MLTVEKKNPVKIGAFSGKAVVAKIKARKILTKMYEGFLIAGICTCWLNEYAISNLSKNVDKIMKDAGVTFNILDFELHMRCCVDSKEHWERLLDELFE